ncbi:MAG: hypothetical protein LBD31_02285 [Treponema sp.]|jgi:hypothetical protein|nr:hypothetical protein [Treponema sp.]
MTIEQTMNDMLEDYLRGLIDRKELEGRLFMYIRDNQRRFYQNRWDPDTWQDFISWLYPRMSRAVDRYRDQGLGFDAYMHALVRLSAKEYSLRGKERRIVEKTWWNARAEEMAVCDPVEPDYSEGKPPNKVSNPRQILILLLKSYHYLSETHLTRLAPVVGMDKDKLFHLVEKLRKIRVRREEIIGGLKERIYGQFYRCLAFEKRMLAAPPQSAHRLKMERCLETARKRLLSMRQRLSFMRTEASNKQVAEVLGIAKGTVDSSLYIVKQRNQTENQ